MSQSAALRESLKEVDLKLEQEKEMAARQKDPKNIADSRVVIKNMESGREAHLRLIVQAEEEERNAITRPRLNQEIGVIRSCLRWQGDGNEKRAETRLKELIDWLSRDKQPKFARAVDLLTVVRNRLENRDTAGAIFLLEEVQFSVG